MTNEAEQQFEELLHYLNLSRGFDFTAYKRSSLMRRVQRRMQMVHIEDFMGYLDYLEVHPEEFRSLFNVILINVTAFFRDPAAWEYVSEELIPRIVASRPADPIRVWSAGCASGEEAYSLAMLLAEALGLDEFKQRVKIYATDVDEEALNQGRTATYRAKEVSGIVPDPLVERYFDRQGDRYIFNKELRRSVIFGRHDLIQDAPISRVNLLVCRNCLMYLNAEAQSRVLERLHFALDETGFIFLGKAEMLFSRQDMFRPVDLKRRIFNKVHKRTAHGQVLMNAFSPNGEGFGRRFEANAIRSLAFESDALAQLAIDGTGTLVLANSTARTMFGISQEDIGRPLKELEISHRPFALQSLLERPESQRRTLIERTEMKLGNSGELSSFEVQSAPLIDGNGQFTGYHVTFRDVSAFRQLEDALKHSNQELETAYEEIQSTNEELETTNEELQSSNEELETTNEELQSTNEELETMNEELQSTNEELQTANEELRLRGDELNQVNGFLESILSSMPDGVVVLDNELRILAWNHRAEDLWGLRSDEVRGKHFLNLDIGLPVLELTQPIRACLSDSTNQERTIDALNRRGKRLAVQVTCSRLQGPGRLGVAGVILTMKEATEPTNGG
jgi:two-component system, chemotaxis family, CheB/CheR fusion protein